MAADVNATHHVEPGRKNDPLNGIQEVVSSIPIGSTNHLLKLIDFWLSVGVAG